MDSGASGPRGCWSLTTGYPSTSPPISCDQELCLSSRVSYSLQHLCVFTIVLDLLKTERKVSMTDLSQISSLGSEVMTADCGFPFHDSDEEESQEHLWEVMFLRKQTLEFWALVREALPPRGQLPGSH